MSLLARSVATLEGIALVGDPDYQMVTQVRGCGAWRCDRDHSQFGFSAVHACACCHITTHLLPALVIAPVWPCVLPPLVSLCHSFS
jgi:hypothetical protein